MEGGGKGIGREGDEGGLSLTHKAPWPGERMKGGRGVGSGLKGEGAGGLPPSRGRAFLGRAAGRRGEGGCCHREGEGGSQGGRWCTLNGTLEEGHHCGQGWGGGPPWGLGKANDSVRTCF